jgi:hypothetical protein
MTNYGDLTSDLTSVAEPSPFADLIADADAVRRVLHLGDAVVELPEQRAIVIPDAVITDRALAVVSGLDIYGD